MIYVLQQTDSSYYKIGFTDNQDADPRVSQLQTGCPRRLVVLGVMPNGTLQEARLHALFWNCKTDGGDEWFKLTTEQVEKLKEL